MDYFVLLVTHLAEKHVGFWQLWVVMKRFTGKVGSMNFSGFDPSSWPNCQHRESVATIKKANNKTNKQREEIRLGCRDSVLLRLPYYDPTRMLIIDPMHNLYLAKRMLSLWMEREIIVKQHNDKIQNLVDTMIVPTGIGRIPFKIINGFAGFKADQFKNWVNIPSLFGIFETDHLECWRHFVFASRILCKHNLTVNDVNLADTLLLQFCKRVQRMYGENVITLNMHLHCHLKDVLLDYGPSHEFWLFPYERYNGTMGNFLTNNAKVPP